MENKIVMYRGKEYKVVMHINNFVLLRRVNNSADIKWAKADLVMELR